MNLFDCLKKIIPELTEEHCNKELIKLKLKNYDLLNSLDLTIAETELITKGSYKSGLINEKNLSELNVIRSEIIELLFRISTIHPYIFSTNKIQFSDIHILTLSEYEEYKKHRSYKIINFSQCCLDLSNRQIAYELFFERCTFAGNINISNSTFYNLTFNYCTVGTFEGRDSFNNEPINASIYAKQVKIDGSLTIDNTQINDENLEKRTSSFETLFSGELYFYNAYIKNSLNIKNVITSYNIDFSFSTLNIVHFTNLKTYNGFVKLYYVLSTNIYFDNVFLFSDDEENDYITLECYGLQGNGFFFRNSSISIGKASLIKMNIKEFINLYDCVFISPKKAGYTSNIQNEEVVQKDDTLVTDIAVDMSETYSKTFNLFPNFNSIGQLVLRNIYASNIYFNHSKFLNYELNNAERPAYGKAIIMNSAMVENSILFNAKHWKKMGSKGFWLNDKYSKDLKSFLLSKNDELSNNKDSASDYNKIIKAIENVTNKNSVISKLETLHNEPLPNEPYTFFQSLCKSNNKEFEDIEYLNFLIDTYTVIIGEADLSSSHVKMQIDCAGALFYGANHELMNPDFKPRNALNLKYTRLDGDLFLNDFDNHEDIPHFKAVGEVDLHSARVGQLFINPQRGKDKHNHWRTIGLKYDYIYSGGHKQLLEECEWFKSYKDDDNYRQPYEQLSAAYYKVGEDAKAKNVLIKSREKLAENDFEKHLFKLFGDVAEIGSPLWKSVITLILIYLLGILLFAIITPYHPTSEHILYAALLSFENMLPINITDNVVIDGQQITYSLGTAFFIIIHKIAGYLYFAFFIIGITKITKKES